MHSPIQKRPKINTAHTSVREQPFFLPPPLERKCLCLLCGYWKLRRQMSEEVKPLPPNGKNLSTIGYLTGGAVPSSRFTIIWASYEGCLPVCPPPSLPLTLTPTNTHPEKIIHSLEMT